MKNDRLSYFFEKATQLKYIKIKIEKKRQFKKKKTLTTCVRFRVLAHRLEVETGRWHKPVDVPL